MTKKEEGAREERGGERREVVGSGRGLGEVSGVQRGSAGVGGGAEKGWELGLKRFPLFGGKEERGGGRWKAPCIMGVPTTLTSSLPPPCS